MSAAGIATVRVPGLGYEPEYFELDGHEVVHVAVTHVDPLVRAFAPVWLPHIAPTPLCGLGRGGSQRRMIPLSRAGGRLCRHCNDHLSDLNEWVREAERQLVGVGGGAAVVTSKPVGNRVHKLPF